MINFSKICFYIFFTFGFLFLSTPANTSLIKRGDGVIILKNLHLGETLTIKYRDEKGRYNQNALTQVETLLRCRKTHEVHNISIGLLEIVDQIQDHFHAKEVHVISGYRSPNLNNQLRATGHKVAKHSLHMEGEAMDIRIPNQKTLIVRNYALSLKRGGVGYYPYNQFVHVDVGNIRKW